MVLAMNVEHGYFNDGARWPLVCFCFGVCVCDTVHGGALVVGIREPRRDGSHGYMGCRIGVSSTVTPNMYFER